MNIAVALFRFAVAWFAFLGTKTIFLEGDLDGLVYFTNQSGIMLAVVMIWAGVASLRGRGQPPAWFKGAVTLFLAITGLISYFVLAPEAADAPDLFLGLTSGQIEHQLTPVLALVDFVLFDAHRRLRWGHAALWLSYLVAYATFTTIRAEFLAVPDYPYGFVDLGELGWGGLALNIAIYGVGFYLLGLLLVAIDRVMPMRALIGSASDDASVPNDAPAPGDAPVPDA
jgi:hypothetical protein